MGRRSCMHPEVGEGACSKTAQAMLRSQPQTTLILPKFRILRFAWEVAHHCWSAALDKLKALHTLRLIKRSGAQSRVSRFVVTTFAQTC